MALLIPSPLNNPDFLGSLFHRMQMHADAPLDARITEGLVSALEPLKRDLERILPLRAEEEIEEKPTRTAETDFFSITERARRRGRAGADYTLQHRGEEGRRFLDFQVRDIPGIGKTEYSLDYVRSEAGFSQGIAIFMGGVVGRVRSHIHFIFKFEEDQDLLSRLKCQFELSDAASMLLLGLVISSSMTRTDKDQANPFENLITEFHDLGEGRFSAEGRGYLEANPSYCMDYDRDDGLSIQFYSLPMPPLMRRRLWEFRR